MKKGLSQVVATILLVLISVIAVGILAGVIIPWVTESLDNSCLKILDKAQIDKDAYACYDGRDVKLSIKIEDITVKGFVVSIFGEGRSQKFNIPGTGVTMFGGGTVELPNPGEERTYILATNLNQPGSAELGIVTESDKLCEAGSVELYPCTT